MTKQERADIVLERLRRRYPKRGPFVQWSNPLELVIATVLSAQCTDKKVNEVTMKLFQIYRTAADYANAPIAELERAIFSTGFYRTKARYLKGIGQMLVAKWNGEVPQTLEDLLLLPGVARKTAYLVLAKAFGKQVGIAVDTHVRRVAPRLGLSQSQNPNTISADLMELYAPKDYLTVNEVLIMHGRATCMPKPKCAECPLRDVCPSAKIFLRLSS